MARVGETVWIGIYWGTTYRNNSFLFSIYTLHQADQYFLFSKKES
jgi:hypothetical protein